MSMLAFQELETFGPDPSKAYGGLTPQQYAYCLQRAQGAGKLAAYRAVFEVEHWQDASVQDAAYKLERDARIVQTINRAVSYYTPKTNLVPLITRDFVQQGIAEIAMSKTAKDTVRLRAFELLGKMPHIGLFKDDGAPPDKTRSLEEVERELKEKLASILTVEGEARRVTPVESSGEPVESSGLPAKRERRRKPHD